MSRKLVSIDSVAQVCHEANRAYCKTIGDDTQPGWEEAPEWQRRSAAQGVIFHASNPDASPSASHENWMKDKITDGWVYGEVKDSDKKTHPCLVDWEKLPEEQRVKDMLFKAIAGVFADGQ